MVDPLPPSGSSEQQTQWSRIQLLSAPPASGEDARRGWEDAWLYLWETFRPAMLATVRRSLARIGGGIVSAGEAEDIVQSFFAACLEHDYLARADANLGRFRTFVAVCLRRHTTKYVEYRRRQRRSPPAPLRSLDAENGQVALPETQDEWESAFERDWVGCLLNAALPRVGERSRPNEQLLRALCANPGMGADELALRLEVDKSKIALRLHRARKMLAEEFWEVVKQTVSDAGELEEERARLFSVLARHLELENAPSLFTHRPSERERPTGS